MTALQNKIDFVVLASVSRANPNGDPLNGNRPRTDYNGFGEISDVCIKRKIRNRMQDEGYKIFVQSDDRCDDGCRSLSERAKNAMKNIRPEDACALWMDVRAFGQVFAFSGGKKGKSAEKESGESGVSVSVRGPVSIHQAVSVSPVEVHSMQITKSVNGDPSEKRSSDTMGSKHWVRFGLYRIKGSINVQLAEKTGFSEEDAEALKRCLQTLFRNDASSARPDGSMEVLKVYWWRHNCKDGQYSSAKVHRSLKIIQKDENKIPESPDDYEIILEPLSGLEPEILDGE